MKTESPITNTLAIIGLGLIGGSFAKALKRAGAVREIWAFDHNPKALSQALELGIIDRAIEFEALVDADVIVLSTPVAAFFPICQALSALSLKEYVVITDVGSTKHSVFLAMQSAFGEVPAFFVPAHPIAGREKSGVEAADEDLFVRHKVIVSTLPHTQDRALGIVSRLWHQAGASVSYMPIDAHDEILGATSHLPHVLAYLLVDMLNQDLHHEDIFSYAAGGFRDFTRIASSSPVMWRDICVHNAEVLQQLLTTYEQRIQAFKALLSTGDESAIEELFTRAKAARDNHYNQQL
ncbi:MAG: prephenate dehydrogenase/arogenate dehydrogenase family protein [Cardiobacteriaceae bacterium]|nr:prephenate dehydrogenase/arogenate dehydrogenase family protein [Cardiobacteriaceae bacterium]